VVTVLLVLLSIGVLIAGFWFGFVRQSYFVGTDSAGLITLYRGVPVDVTEDFSLYEPVTATTVAAADLPDRQRAAVLGHQLRSYGDAADLVQSLEEQAAEEEQAAARRSGDEQRPGDGQPNGGGSSQGGGSRQGGSGQQDNDGAG
jgi:hypothetical protein